MSFLSDFESSIEYIEDNLTSEIDFNIAAKKAKCSSYHFQRLFSSLVGIPLSEYIRRRRITQAAIELQNSDHKVIDVALKYGYDSHSSFTRTFQQLQGITPTKARMAGVPLVAYPPLSFQFTIKGVEAMKYQILETEAYRLFGRDAVTTDGWKAAEYLDYADLVIENGCHDAINVAAGFPGVALEMIAKDAWDVSKIHLLQGIHFWKEDGTKYFMYGWEVPEAGVGDGFLALDVPRTTWVVVTALLDGDRAAIAQCYQDLYVNWFPASGYEQAPGCPVIEKYDAEYAVLWMPIIRKGT
jgi:AraC family transcriptional regulator